MISQRIFSENISKVKLLSNMFELKLLSFLTRPIKKNMCGSGYTMKKLG